MMINTSPAATMRSSTARIMRLAGVMLLLANVHLTSAHLDLRDASSVTRKDDDPVVSTSRSLKSFKVPFTAEALDFVDYHKINEDTDNGNCPLRSPVDAKYFPQEGCLSECVVGWTEAGEWLEYEFESEKDGFVDISARLSSKRQKYVSLYLDGHRITDHLFNLPGNGWDNFLDETVTGVYIQGGVPHRLRVLFIDGKVNLCSISVFSFREEDGCSAVAECEECIDEEDCSWVPELGKCLKEEACEATGHNCWDVWYSKPLCDVDHCYRRESCADCLFETDECAWFYSFDRGLVCRPAAHCSPYDDCFLPHDVLGMSEDLCDALDDDTCSRKTSCAKCLQTASCGWVLRQQDDPGCIPSSVCGLNCYTSSVSASTGETPEIFCERLDVAFELDAQFCGQASDCKDC
jgi:hypothetical protein